MVIDVILFYDFSATTRNFQANFFALHVEKMSTFFVIEFLPIFHSPTFKPSLSSSFATTQKPTVQLYYATFY